MVSLKELIKRAIRRNGLEVRAHYTLQTLQEYPATSTKGWAIEMIGTKGAGKSTLFSLSLAKLKSRWFFQYHLRDLVLTSVQSDEIEGLHRDILFNRLDTVIHSQQEPWQSITAVSQSVTAVYASMYMSCHTFPRGFALEEGLFKNFPREVLQLNKQTSLPLWNGKCFIYLRASNPNIVLERFHNRRSQRLAKGVFQHEESNDELSQRVHSDTFAYDRIVERADELGIPTLVIDANDDMDSLVGQVLRFEESLFTNGAGASSANGVNATAPVSTAGGTGTSAKVPLPTTTIRD
ncbi:hypothetical protein NG895_15730 [Aeoliella sp. ICT_H6.2]|uniref:Uncharacterized protein n=1 Tax=Aeoliella straminimaris TaxID=2954799 RepID=A0A9X2FAE4_9BACT|nr:hypothetical protein [Aeoliella straminimaris]MCO6045362.1 hypothetical protein [Aeoliella straminimaris]